MTETRVAQSVRACIKASGNSLRGFAVALKISPAYLSDLQRGNRRLSPRMAARLALRPPRRSVRDWLLLQVDDDLDALKRKRAMLARGAA